VNVKDKKIRPRSRSYGDFAIISKRAIDWDDPDGCNSAMKTKTEILRILEEQKPELVRRYGLKSLALFGSDTPSGTS
jgi:hypothetical protein